MQLDAPLSAKGNNSEVITRLQRLFVIGLQFSKSAGILKLFTPSPLSSFGMQPPYFLITYPPALQT